MTRVVVDSDVYAYACGGATQTTVYDFVAVMGGDVIECGIAENKTDLEAVRSSLPEGAELRVEAVTTAEPLEHALSLCKRSLLAIEEAMDARGVEFDKLELCLTGKGNFREQIATIKGYKANRIGKERPVHYKAIRRYMRERWGATVVKGYEADDALAMAAHEHDYDGDRVVLVSQDKDLRTVPGLHYNARKKTWSGISAQEALVTQYRQCLAGDAVDSIPGIYKCGPKRAEAVIGAEMSEEEMWAAALLEAQTSLGRKGCPYVDMGARAALLENMRLVYMCRTVAETTPEGLWAPPGER